MRRLAVAVLTGALVAALPPSVSASPLPSPGPEYPATQPGQTVQGVMAPSPPVQVSIALDEPARAGGRGSVDVALTRRELSGPALRNVRVKVTSAKGTAVRSASGRGWTCSTARGVANCTRARVSAQAGTHPIRTVVTVRKTYRKATARVTARAKWKGGPASKRANVSSTRIPVYKPLRVSLGSVSGPRVSLTSHDGPASRQFLLSARLRGIDGAQVDARWRQLSGPRAAMLHPTHITSAKQQVGQTIQVRNNAPNARYRFALIVDANGQKVTRTVVVRTRMQRKLGDVDGNNAAFSDLAAASRDQDKTRAHAALTSNRLRLRAAPRLTVPPGQNARLRVVTPRKIASVRWTVGSQSAGNGRSLRVAAPSVPRSSRLVTAHVTLRNGDVLSESALVRSSAGDAPQDDGPEDADIAAVCSLADEAARLVKTGQGSQNLTLDLGGKYTLKVAAKDLAESDDFRDDTDECKGQGQLDLEGASLLRGKTTQLVEAVGSLSATDGVSITNAGWALPDTFASATGVKSLALASSKGVTAPLKDGQWGLPSGDLAVQPFSVAGKKFYAISFLPLPGDWEFVADQSILSFVNKTKAAPEIADATMRYSQQAQGGGASVAMTADSVDDAWSKLRVTVANASLGQTASGSTIMAAGDGTLDLTEAGTDSSIDIAISCKGGGDQACELVKGFFVKDFRLKWNRKVIGIVGTAMVRYGDPAKSYEFGVRGAYAGTGDWSLDAVSAADWDLGASGLQLSGLAGSVGMKPTAKDPKTSILQAQFTGAIKGFRTTSGVTVTKVAGSLSNICPTDDKTCSPGEIRLTVSVGARAQLPGRKDPVALSTNAAMNLMTEKFRFDFGFEDVKIGPDPLNITKAQFIMSNEDTGGCTPKGDSEQPADPGAYSLQVLAQAKILDADVAIGGTVDDIGYCLWGKPGTIDLDKVGKTRTQIFGYTNYPNGADLRLPTGEKVVLKANKMAISGLFTLPADVEKTFGIPAGNLGYEASYTADNKGLSFDLFYQPTEAVKVYSNDRATLTLTGITFGISVMGSAKSATLRLGADGALFMKGGAGTPDSTTPLGMSAEFTFGAQIEATFQAGVRTDDGVVVNAFGQPGLTVRQLAASFTLKLPNPTGSIAFNADVTLPQEWVGSVGIKRDAREAVALALSETNWCVAVELGEESTANTAVAVDVANRGFLTAGYFKLVIAPTGCDIPVGASGTRRIAPGFGFAFVGRIVGAPLIASINATWQDGLAMDGTIEVPSLDLYAVRIEGSQPGTPLKIVFDVNSKASKYDVAFDGGIAIGRPQDGIGAFVAVKGALKTSDPNFTDFSLSGSSAINLGVINVNVNQLFVNGHIAKDSKNASQNALNVRGDMTVNALGIGVRAAGALNYQHQQLVELMITAGASLNIVIASVSGSAQFNYCLGTLSGIDSRQGSSCTPYAKYTNAKPAYRVGFFGSYRILWWTKPYTWAAFDQKGTEGTLPPPPTNDPGLVDGGIPSVVPKPLEYAQLEAAPDLTWNSASWGQAYFKTVMGKAGDGLPACDVARLGANWEAGASNPATVNVDPDPRSRECGMLVDWATFRDQKVHRMAVTCSAASCIARDGELRQQVIPLVDSSGRPNLKAGRDALLAGLRTPSGVQPGGATMLRRGLVSPDGNFVLDARLDKLRLINYASPGQDVVWAIPAAAGKKATVRSVTKDGLLQGLADDGSVVYSAGTKAPLDTDKYPVYLFVQDGFTVLQTQADGPPKPVWGVKPNGECFPKPESCK